MLHYRTTPMDDAPVASRPASRSAFAAGLALVATVALAFAWPSRDGEFLDGDDLHFIRDHVLVNHPSWANAGRLLTMIHGDLYQPLPMLTFTANYALHDQHTRGYHLVNMAIHAFNAVLVAAIAARLARRRGVGLLTGVMFACHPFAMETVAWITGRIVLLAVAFSLIVLAAFVFRCDSPTRRWTLGVCVAWLLSLASKVLPAVPLAAAWCDWHVHVRRGRRWFTTLGLLLAMAGGMSVLALYSTGRQDYFALMQKESTTAYPARVMLASRYYFENYLRPTRLCAWSPPPIETPILSLPAAIGAAEWTALFALMILSRRRCPPAFIGIGLFALLLSPFLAAMTARTFLTADRYMYLPIMGLHLAVAAWAVKAWDGLRARATSLLPGAAVAGAGLAVLAAWMSQGWRMADVFRDTMSQALRAVTLYPDDVRAWVELSHGYVKNDEPFAALHVVNEQRRRWPDEPGFAATAGEALWSLQEFRAAIVELDRAIVGRPFEHRLRYYRALCLAALGRTIEARAAWLNILEDKNQFLPAATALARSYRDEGDRAEAMRWFDAALRMNPHHRDALFELALLQMDAGDWPAAEMLLQRILDLDPADRPAQFNLAQCRARRADIAGAMALYDELRRVAPDNPMVRFNRAELVAALGRTQEAEAEYREILRLWPGQRAAAIGLHELLQRAHRFGELTPLWDDVLRADEPPDDAAAWRVFSLALAGRTDEAVAGLDRLPHHGPGALLTLWTRAWIQLATVPRDDQALADAVDAAAARAPASVRDHEQLRVAVDAISAWGTQHDDDPAACYVAARALELQRKTSLARRFAEVVARLEGPDGFWARRAAALLDQPALR